jgi:hypothetical protein
MIKWAGHVVHTKRGRMHDRILMGKPERKRPLGKTEV